MELPLFLQFSIALLTGTVAATLVPTVRKSIPRPIEVAAWIALVAACFVGMISVTNPKARDVTTAAFWGVDQVINTLAGLVGAGVLSWLGDHRFTIATVMALVCAVDILALAMARSHRQARASQPHVRLGEWMLLPRLSAPELRPVAAHSRVDELNRKWAAAFAVAGASLLAGLVNLSIWARDVLLPRHAERLVDAGSLGSVESRARLESLRDTASQLQFAARSWYTAAGAPVVNGLAAKAAALEPSRVADIRVLLSARSIGWVPAEAEEEDKGASGHTDRLAS